MKTILITGSGKRLGRHLAIKFAEKGNNIILHYNSSEKQAYETKKLIENYNVKTLIYKANLENIDEIQNFADFIEKNELIPSILINNSAIFPLKSNLQNLTYNQWQKTLNINLNSIFVLSKILITKFSTIEKIVNIASLGAFHIWDERIDYNVSKAAVIQLTKAMARDLAPNIAVNSVSPSTIYFPNEAPSEPISLNEQKIPYKRFAYPDEVFEAVYFFSYCSNYITGQNINVAGGLDLL
jgi:3-oxoacyl-[acyl-carrier protein] reductase